MTVKNTGTRWYAKSTALFLMWLVSLGMLAGINNLDTREHSSFVLTNAIVTLQASMVTSHLWLEEYLVDAEPANLRKAVANLAEAVRLSRLVLEGGKAGHGFVLPPLHAPDPRARAEAISAQLSALQAIAEQRLSQRAAAGPGSYLDDIYDAVFTKLQGQILELAELVDRNQEGLHVETTRLFYGMFILWSLIVAAAFAGMWCHEARRDLAEMKRDQLVQELADVNHELNDFATIVSHELKAPLRAIGSLAGWLVADYADKFDEQGKERANLLISRVRLLHGLVCRILEYSRAGLAREERSQVDFNHLVSKTIEMLSPPKNITIRVADKLPTLLCQKARFEEVFHNLLDNAIKFMDKPAGEIRVGCVAEGEYWKFSVADNGPGIEEKYFEKIFKLFETLNARGTSESTGFGLALVKKIVEMYGGRIWVEATLGQGSVFYFTVKREAADDAPCLLARKPRQDNDPLQGNETT